MKTRPTSLALLLFCSIPAFSQQPQPAEAPAQPAITPVAQSISVTTTIEPLPLA